MALTQPGCDFRGVMEIEGGDVTRDDSGPYAREATDADAAAFLEYADADGCVEINH